MTQQAQPKRHEIKIDLVSSKKITCECGTKLLEEVVIATKVPGIMAGTSQDQLVQVKILRCVDCKKVIPDHLPFIQDKTEAPEPTKLKLL